MKRLLISFCLIGVVLLMTASAKAQTTEFVFNGDLSDPSEMGTFDMQFRLFDAATDGSQIGTTISRSLVSVSEGKFTVNLDFTATPFSGADRWIEIRTSPPGVGTYTVVTPRAKVLSTPYAIRASIATNADTVGGMPPGNFVQISDPRLTDARHPIAGSSNYIHNSTSAQTASFNVSGTGTVGGAFSAPQYNISGQRVLAAPGDNLFAGPYAGLSHTTAWSNTFFGTAAGYYTTTGSSNSVFGNYAGFTNVSGAENSIFGRSAGYSNLASFNSFFGSGAGRYNTVGERNSYYGLDSGYKNTTGSRNAFYGNASGRENTSGSENTHLGYQAGYSNTSGSNNTTVGANASVASGLTYATAIGSWASVSTSNTVVLGRTSDTVRVSGKLFLNSLGTAGGSPICRNSSGEIAFCSSSIRYKSNITPYTNGLEIVNRLRPVSFNWKQDGAMDFGLVAEDVNEIEPLLSNYNDSGEIEGVKYDRVSVVLINAIKQQQVQLDEQRRRIDELKVLLCEMKPRMRTACRTDATSSRSPQRPRRR